MKVAADAKASEAQAARDAAAAANGGARDGGAGGGRGRSVPTRRGAGGRGARGRGGKDAATGAKQLTGPVQRLRRLVCPMMFNRVLDPLFLTRLRAANAAGTIVFHTKEKEVSNQTNWVRVLCVSPKSVFSRVGIRLVSLVRRLHNAS